MKSIVVALKITTQKRDKNMRHVPLALMDANATKLVKCKETLLQFNYFIPRSRLREHEILVTIVGFKLKDITGCYLYFEQLV